MLTTIRKMGESLSMREIFPLPQFSPCSKDPKIMTTKFLCASFVVLAAVCAGFGQGVEPTPTPVKLVVTNTMPPIRPAATPAPRPSATPIVVQSAPKTSGPSTDYDLETTDARKATTNSVPASYSGHALGFRQIKSLIAEAKRDMQTRPTATASSEPLVPTDFVRIAFQDTKTNRIDYVTLTKDSFLSLSDKTATSQNGRNLTVRTLRANGVNTPVTITDDNGQAQLPLMVQYPVVREGKYVETAYYMSTHPGIVTPEVVSAGKYYVHNVIELAREKLRERGVTIQPKVADMAERLATVEHVDHQRFKNEYHPNIFNDIFTLYALNEGQTYRYSVSSAGAGGMVQMIPSTYRMVRSQNPQVNLMPDFVEGMRNHVNATQAMLLYMQRTWNDLVSSPTVSQALSDGTATPEQLMAAGYNSNPARLASYINRGGQNWTNLIPRETQIYLQIFDSLDKYVPMTPRSR